ncbi:MAG: hypothetical protein NHB15_05095 [Methanosarcina barkeri]|nr:hypothetical protein [Methanosarcina sp. ERenArc_MAG2]
MSVSSSLANAQARNTDTPALKPESEAEEISSPGKVEGLWFPGEKGG